MGLELYMVGVIVEDMPRALEFYRRLGLDVPDGADDQDFVEIKMSGLTFFLATKEQNARWDPARKEITGDGYRIVLEFYLETFERPRGEVRGAHVLRLRGHLPPYDVTASTRFAMVDDPDGNTILLSAFAT